MVDYPSEPTEYMEIHPWFVQRSDLVAAAVAARAALRGLPSTLLRSSSNSEIAAQVNIVSLSGLAMSRTALKFQNLKDGARRNSDLGQRFQQIRENRIHSSSFFQSMHFLSTVISRILGYNTPDLPVEIGHLFGVAITSSLNSPGAIRNERLAAVWADCQWCDNNNATVNAILARPLWPNGMSSNDAKPIAILEGDQNWQENWAPWPKWLALKLKGSLSEWGLLPEGEQEMARRLIEADDHFWEEGERNPASINATIAEWIAEISAEDALGSNKRSVDFFISYTESDEAMAREVSTVLEGAGYSTFLQFKDMPSGSNFIIEMDRGLSISKGFIPLYSPAYFKSDFCRQELAAAMALDPIGEKRFIRALLLEPTELPMLARQIVYRNLAGLGVNARTTVIHELADYVRRPQLREEVAAHAQEIISPKPVETEAGKIAVTPNPDYDVPANPQDFLDPGRQITGLLKALLRSLDANAPKLMLNNLVEYEEELRTKGASASWGKLDRLMHYAEMSFQGADPREFESGVAEQFRDILGLHAMLGTELPRADEKFNKLADTEIDENASGPAITAPMQSIEHAAEALRAEGITEPSFDRTAEEIVRNGRDVAYESEPRSLPQIDPTDPTALDHVGVPAVSSKKAAIIASLGFALTLYDLLGTTVSIADSATVVTVMRYLRSAIDALMALLG
jgi:hypothetical protein